MWITLLCILGALGYAQADCYPGDTAFTAIVQEVYHGVTSDSINFEAFSSDQPSGSITRQHLCSILTNHHNNGRNPGQLQTNRDYLRYVTVSESKCIQALTYPQGYDNINGWIQWRGSHSGYWYSKMGQFTDNAVWFYPYYKQGAKHLYVVQPVRFDSQYRIDHCKHRDSTGATCRDGWNQSGQGVKYIWGWDPKDNGCTRGGRRGAHVGFPFDIGSTHCIVWVTPEEAFLECISNGRRTSTTSGSGLSEGYGQWNVN